MKLLPERVQEAVSAAEAKYTVAQIASRCDVSVQSVYDWRKGKIKHLKGETLVELAEVSGYSPRWIINGKGKKLALSSEEKDLLLAFSLFGDEVRDMWLLQARAKIAETTTQSKTG